MGLLDDAIREHLDLRRRHGADPAEVTREELDALAPVPRDGDRDRQQPMAGERERALFDGEHVADRVLEADEASGSGATKMTQETAEIDMRSILDDGGLDDLSLGSRPEDGRRVERTAQVC
jgi:hypothetical protein